MIEDKIEDKVKAMNANKENAKSLAKMVKKAMSLTDRLALQVNKYHDEKEYGVMVSLRTWIAVGATNPYLVATSAFRIEPVIDNNGDLRGVNIYAGFPKEKENSYNLAKDFAKKFEEKYLGKYKIEIRSS